MAQRSEGSLRATHSYNTTAGVRIDAYEDTRNLQVGLTIYRDGELVVRVVAVDPVRDSMRMNTPDARVTAAIALIRDYLAHRIDGPTLTERVLALGLPQTTDRGLPEMYAPGSNV